MAGRRAIMRQSWHDLLFAHWPLPTAALRPLVPAPLVLDEYDGTAWLGITPFEVARLAIRHLPRLPIASRFPELNLRTYVRYDGRAGVYFFTLDAASWPAVVGARLAYGLPYRPARMRLRQDGDWFDFRSARVGSSARFQARYRPLGPAFEAHAGSLEHFLTERYSLFVVRAGARLLRSDIEHAPWTLQQAEARIAANTIAAARGITLPRGEPLLHFAARQDTLVWLPRRVG